MSKFADENLEFITITKSENKSKALTDEHKQAIWEGFAQKTARQEIMFKRVFDSVFDEQKKQVIEQLKK